MTPLRFIEREVLTELGDGYGASTHIIRVLQQFHQFREGPDTAEVDFGRFAAGRWVDVPLARIK